MIHHKSIGFSVIPDMLLCTGAVELTVKSDIVGVLDKLRFLGLVFLGKQKRHDVLLALVQVITVS